MTAILGWLWDAVAGPVLDRLGITGPPAPDEPWPHVWWCVAGPLSFLPLHAAGHHLARPDASPATVIDRVVSSYTPTIQSLNHALRPGQASDPEVGSARSSDRHAVDARGQIAVVAMRRTPGLPDLPDAWADAGELVDRFPGRLRVLAGPQATREAVLDALEEARWVHFGCHGSSDPAHPSASRLLLYDYQQQPLTVVDVNQLQLEHAELAFLPACETSRFGDRVTDEAIHLTSAFQLAGYRQVVGALWLAGGGSADVVSEVQAALAVDGTPVDAVHTATRHLRDRYSAKPSVWAAHIHVGAGALLGWIPPPEYSPQSWIARSAYFTRPRDVWEKNRPDGPPPAMMASGRIGGTHSHPGFEPVRVHVRAQADPECLVQQIFTVSVVLSWEEIRQAGGQAGARSRINAVERRPLVVEVVPRAQVETVGTAEARVAVPKPGRPRVVLFDLRAAHEGSGEVWVVVRQGQAPLCTLTLSIAIGHALADRASKAVDEASLTATGVGRPLHMLRIIEQRQGDGVVYRYDLEAPDLRLLAAFTSRPVRKSRDVYIQSLYRRIEDGWALSDRDPDLFHDQLRAFGGELLDELVPDELRRLLWEHRHQLRNIIVLSTEPFVPWELLHLKAPGTNLLPDETCFLGQLGLVRWLWGSWPPERLVLRSRRARFVAPDYPDPEYHLPELTAERGFLTTELDAIPVEPRHNHVVAALRGGGFDLLHFAGHAVAAPDDIADAHLLLEGRLARTASGSRYVPEPLRASLVAQYMAPGADGARPIVVVNACQAGRLGHQLSSIGGFAQAFLGAGAGVFVGTLWSVGDSPALAFVQAFYRRLLAGDTLAEATVAGREAARALGDATWLAYTVYGHPEARLDRSLPE